MNDKMLKLGSGADCRTSKNGVTLSATKQANLLYTVTKRFSQVWASVSRLPTGKAVSIGIVSWKTFIHK